MISSFRGEYQFLSNFFYWPIWTWDWHTAMSVEHAYQAEKMKSVQDRHRVLRAATPGVAKKMARSMEMVENWNDIRLMVMKFYVARKFDDPVLRERLLATEDQLLIEGNTWNDRFWGMVYEGGRWEGENHLGLILMEVRADATQGNQRRPDGCRPSWHHGGGQLRA